MKKVSELGNLQALVEHAETQTAILRELLEEQKRTNALLEARSR